jgi:sterol desaturase/sphingolipid hydroxylase (fatty acid hydroxylase superfamily)
VSEERVGAATRPMHGHIMPVIALALLVTALYVLERFRPLRAPVEPGPRRILRNLAIAALTAGSLAVTERPLLDRLIRKAERDRLGLIPELGLPPFPSLVIALVLLDYTLYVWHILLHRLPLLWRLHLPHHVDLDLDVSTALRFHFGEFIASIPWRIAQVIFIGVSSRALALWRGLTFAEVAFHHANLRLPLKWERRIALVIVTPRLHGIHHSVVQAERNSNFSSGLTIWDRLHGTLRTGTDREAIAIGVPPYREPDDVTLSRTLKLPFVRE